MQLQRYTGTPIPKPRADHTWEARAVFNGAAVYHNRLCHMLYRAVAANLVLTIGYGVTTPGFRPWAGTWPATRTSLKLGTMPPGLLCRSRIGPTRTAPQPGCGGTCAPWNRSSTS